MRPVVLGAFLRSGKLTPFGRKCFSLSSASRGVEQQRVIIEKDDETGIATMSLNRPPVNSLGLDLLNDIVAGIDKVESESRGLVLTSSSKAVFCAGLDLLEMHDPNEARLRDFWTALQEVWLRLYALKVPASAAICGHAPAGGALLAMCCDYRVMQASDKFTIGLNEAKFGLVAPPWFIDTFVATVGQREAEHGLQLGKLYGVDEALRVGLIDKVVGDRPTVQAQSRKAVVELNTSVPQARHMTKMALRKGPLERLVARRAKDTDDFVALVMQDKLQKALGAYISSLGGKK